MHNLSNPQTLDLILLIVELKLKQKALQNKKLQLAFAN
jgi:hypothetical protein